MVAPTAGLWDGLKAFGVPNLRISTIVSFILAALLICADCVRIRQLLVPPPMKNGTVTTAVLDCDYTYEDYEKVGLVVKWFLHHKSEPAFQVYQWIPYQTPQDLSVLKGRLDLTYRASEDNYTMHRALRILHPTTELTGDYRCQVSSFETEDDKTERMIVYAPAEHVDIRYRKPSLESVNISCHAAGLYPKPSAEIRLYKGNKESVTAVKGASVSIARRSGLYSVTTYKVFQEKNLAAESEFECVVSIPGTDFSVRSTLVYYPGLSQQSWAAERESSSTETTQNSYLGNTSGSSSTLSHCWWRTLYVEILPLSVLLLRIVQMYFRFR